MSCASKVIFICALACACASQPDICTQAEDLVYQCRGLSVDFGTCDSPEAQDAAELVVAGGCAGLDESKADVFTQACQGFLRKVFPWCKPEKYECTANAEDHDSARCNQVDGLCQRGYDDVVYATSHNAHNAATMGFIRPNQSKRLYVQLRDGVRALMIDVYEHKGEAALCHGLCDKLGSQPLREGLQEVKDFLDCYPQEIVTLIIEPHTSSASIVDVMESAGLADLAFAHKAADPWPTLGEMVAADKRLMVFAEEPGIDAPDWYHHQWDYAFDNEFSVGLTGSFRCELERGSANAPLFGLNHFRTVIGGDEFLSLGANRFNSLMDHVDLCESTFGRLPNFLAIDFHDIGSIREVVNTLNARP